jgi:hypothetical protein
MNDNFTALVSAINALQARVAALESTAVDSSVTDAGAYAVSGSGSSVKAGTKSGYLTLHGGLIIEWGTVAGNLASGTVSTVTFPKAFPNGLLYCNASIAYGDNTDTAIYFNLATSDKTKASFERRNNNNSFPSGDYTWIAVGY